MTIYTGCVLVKIVISFLHKAHNPMPTMTKTDQILNKLNGLCPKGYTAGLHIRFTTPLFLFQTCNEKWLGHYTDNSLVLHDPTIHWGFANTGSILWQDLHSNDPMGVLTKAAEFGLNYGFTLAIFTENSRSISSFARQDRNYSDGEIAEICDLVQSLHDITLNPDLLDQQELQSLKRTSISPDQS